MKTFIFQFRKANPIQDRKALGTKEAQKQYSKLKQSDRLKIDKKLRSIVSDPCSGNKLSGEHENEHSLKAWPYRIIYVIFTLRKEVWITSILHRQGAYK